jgi:hypothetical protein
MCCLLGEGHRAFLRIPTRQFGKWNMCGLGIC